MSNKLVKKYYWKVLSDDGLLKDPPKFGAYYESEDINGYGGFESEHEAVMEFMDFNKRFEYEFRDDYVLITTYRVVDENWN